MATDAPKLLYIEVVDDANANCAAAASEDGAGSSSFRYTRSMLQSTLQLMGCKARHAFKISRRVFDIIRTTQHRPGDCGLAQLKVPCPEPSEGAAHEPDTTDHKVSIGQWEGRLLTSDADESSSIPYELYKKLTTVVIPRETFLEVVCNALTQYKYVGPNQRADLILACRIRERKESFAILLCGTSGCGKSTLSSLLGSRLGVTTVISTDSIRHMMRSFIDEKQNPLLWASTYHAGEHLDPVAVAEAKTKQKAKKSAGVAIYPSLDTLSDGVVNHNGNPAVDGDLVSKKLMAIEGYKAQSEMVIESLDRLITTWEDRKESVVVEGVHLSLNFVVGLMKKHPSIIPFMIYITNEDKHMERFAVRAKYMTLDPSKNKYVKYIRNIRTIQDYLCNRADKHLVPKINNTNVDRSVAAIHATVFSCLRRRAAGEQLYDPTTNTVPIVDAEYRNQCAANTLSSKGMFQLIQRKGSSRHLMALVENDGSVAKVWPMESVDENTKLLEGEGVGKELGDSVYDVSSIGKAEPVNLQFGSFGISAWPNDTGGTSHNGSIDESMVDCGTDPGSRYHSSCCSSPRMSDVPEKEPKEELSVSGSDDEVDVHPEADTDDDLSDADEKLMQEEGEGSVDEESTKSDEYDDLAILDDAENGYWSDDDESFNGNKKLLQGKGDTATQWTDGGSSSNKKLLQEKGDTATQWTDGGSSSNRSSDQKKYLHNLDVFLRSSGDRRPPLPDQPCSHSLSLLSVNGGRRNADGTRFFRMRRHSFGDASLLHGHAQGIAAVGRRGSDWGFLF